MAHSEVGSPLRKPATSKRATWHRKLKKSTLLEVSAQIASAAQVQSCRLHVMLRFGENTTPSNVDFRLRNFFPVAFREVGPEEKKISFWQLLNLLGGTLCGPTQHPTSAHEV